MNADVVISDRRRNMQIDIDLPFSSAVQECGKWKNQLAYSSSPSYNQLHNIYIGIDDILRNIIM